MTKRTDLQTYARTLL